MILHNAKLYSKKILYQKSIKYNVIRFRDLKLNCQTKNILLFV